MSNKKSIVCFGVGPGFKGGMANYNIALAKALDKFEDVDVHMVSWTQQYPSIVPREFSDKVSKTDLLEGTNISCTYLTNYNNPLSWSRTAKHIASLNPHKVIIQWSIAIQGLPIGSIVSKLKKISKAEIIIDLHFVIQKERSKIDNYFTRRGIKNADTYIVHALKTYEELTELFPNRKFALNTTGERQYHTDGESTPVIKLFHPIYDLYQPDPKFDIEAFKKQNNLRDNVFLFFGFIRKYKGLHNALRAFHLVSQERQDVSFLVCGELFWHTMKPGFISKLKKMLFSTAKKVLMGSKEQEQNYNPLDIIDELNLHDRVTVYSEYVANEEVHKYFQSANAGILFYSRATPSGIESLSYNFDLPVLTTRVGHFPETVQNGQNGYMTETNDIQAMADVMLKFLDHPIPPQNVTKFKPNLSWQVYAEAILAS